jgi:hypothetical protein
MFEHAAGSLCRLSEIVRSERQATQPDFLVKKIKRVGRDVYAEGRMTTASQRCLKSALDSD